jgi:hypothetical protein
MIFVVDEKLCAWHGQFQCEEGNRVLNSISTHFHSPKSRLGLFTSSKNEYSTAAVEIAIDRSAVTR